MFTAVCSALVFRVAERTTGSKRSDADSATCRAALQRRDLRLRLPRRLLRLLGAFVRTTARSSASSARCATWPRSSATRQAAAAAAASRRQQPKSWLRRGDDAARRRRALPRGTVRSSSFTSAMLTFPFGFFRSSPQEGPLGRRRLTSRRGGRTRAVLNLTIFIVCKFVFTTTPSAARSRAASSPSSSSAPRRAAASRDPQRPHAVSHVITAGGDAVRPRRRWRRA